MSEKKEIKFTIPENPIPKKNNMQIAVNKQTGRPFVVPSKRYREYQALADWYIKKPMTPINYPVNIQCLFYRKNKVRCDLTNLLEAIDDIMVDAGLLADDNFNIIVSHDGSRVYIDSEHPRTEITITPIGEGEES